MLSPQVFLTYTQTMPKNFIARMRDGDLQVYATNVDFAVIVMPLLNPKFSAVILDKYLIICQYGEVAPLIVLNKCDLSLEVPSIIEYYRKSMGIGFLQTSTVSGKGISELKEAIRGKRCVFLGKSGTGKSSLINALGESSEVKVGEVSARYGEGKHTTSSTTEYKLADGTIVIDTPGLRNLDVSNISPEQLRLFYPDFVELQGLCKFNNCTHTHEFKCAVKDAVAHEKIPQERYANYCKISGLDGP